MKKIITYILLAMLFSCMLQWAGCNHSDTKNTESFNTKKDATKLYADSLDVVTDTNCTDIDTRLFKSIKRGRIKPLHSNTELNISHHTDFKRIHQRVIHLKKKEYQYDPNELRGLIRKKLFNEISLETISELSPHQFFSLFTENDIMVSGDLYYTNGSRIAWTSPWVAHSPVSAFLIPYPWHARNYYGISIVQNMYTPSHPDDDKPRPGDRPFAGYMYISHFKKSIDTKRKLKLFSSIDVGIIGPASFGGRFQRAMHQKEPKDWIIQIENDFILNYKLELEKTLIHSRYFQFDLMGGIQAGTIYDNVSVGAQVIIGRINPFMHSFIKDDYNNHKFDLFFKINYLHQQIGYDATLQGGLINKSSPYMLSAEQVLNRVEKASITMNLRLGHNGMEFGFYHIGPEFIEAQSHRWWRLCLTFGF
ncbi:MAG: lipid A deacylase LpxR family protein [Bacteroidales bacterium]|nr:lipid A deacylase LpxR family protein [Bacteroidales bacterium]